MGREGGLPAMDGPGEFGLDKTGEGWVVVDIAPSG